MIVMMKMFQITRMIKMIYMNIIKMYNMNCAFITCRQPVSTTRANRPHHCKQSKRSLPSLASAVAVVPSALAAAAGSGGGGGGSVITEGSIDCAIWAAWLAAIICMCCWYCCCCHCSQNFLFSSHCAATFAQSLGFGAWGLKPEAPKFCCHILLSNLNSTTFSVRVFAGVLNQLGLLVANIQSLKRNTIVL